MQAPDLDGICRMRQGSTFWPSWYLWVEQPWAVHLRRPALRTGCRRPSVPDLVTWIIFSAFLSQPAWLSGISSTVSPSSVSRDSSWVTVPGKLSLTPVSLPSEDLSQTQLSHYTHVMRDACWLASRPVCEHLEGRNGAGFTPVAWYLVRHTGGAGQISVAGSISDLAL